MYGHQELRSILVRLPKMGGYLMSDQTLFFINLALAPFIIYGTIDDWKAGWSLRLIWFVLLGFILNNLYRLFYA